jgi:hypothetical protein
LVDGFFALLQTPLLFLLLHILQQAVSLSDEACSRCLALLDSRVGRLLWRLLLLFYEADLLSFDLYFAAGRKRLLVCFWLG